MENTSSGRNILRTMRCAQSRQWWEGVRAAKANVCKRQAKGEEGVHCLVKSNASLLTSVSNFLPRGDTFETDGFAPVVDGVALRDDLVSRIADGHVAPGVAILAGSNMDEGTIFMGLTPRLRSH